MLACLWQAQEPREGITSLSILSAFATDETDRGVDQQDGKNSRGSSECEESDASKEELLKTRLPTRSDMICGYACLRGIRSSQREVQCTLRDVHFSPPGSLTGEGTGCHGSRVWDTPHVSCAVTFTLWVTPSLLQGLPPCGTPNGVPGTLRPSPRCSPRGRVTCTWPTCS